MSDRRLPLAAVVIRLRRITGVFVCRATVCPLSANSVALPGQAIITYALATCHSPVFAYNFRAGSLLVGSESDTQTKTSDRVPTERGRPKEGPCPLGLDWLEALNPRPDLRSYEYRVSWASDSARGCDGGLCLGVFGPSVPVGGPSRTAGFIA
jgi:hypothetical protein